MDEIAKFEIAKLKRHWRALIEESSYRGKIDTLSLDIGRSEAYLRGLLRNDIVPKMDLIIPMSQALGVSLDKLLRIPNDRATTSSAIADSIASEVRALVSKRLAKLEPALTGKDIMSWWASNGGRLEHCDQFIESVDIYQEPDVDTAQVRTQRLGAESLAAKSLGTASDDLFQRTIAPLGRTFAERILLAHRSSIEGGPVSSIETLDVGHPETGDRITIQYMRTLAPVILPDGSNCVLNYSELLG